ncbi:MAG: armadillo-type protein, partial [Olpidium bornovanus]
MDLIEQAVACALSPHADPALKREATEYCEQLKISPDGWQLCLGLFARDPKSTPEARLFALQVVEHALGNFPPALNPQQLQFIRETLVNFVTREFFGTQNPSAPKDPPYLRNKLAHTLTLLFMHLYPHSWPSFFDDLVALLDVGLTGRTDEKLVDIYLRILMAIDEEVVNLLVPREKGANVRNMNIKDAMRERDIITVANTWPPLLSEYRTRDPAIAAMLMRVVGAYVTWIDISLVVNDVFMSRLYECLDHHPQESGSREIQIAACECFTEVINKGMKSSDKLTLLQLLQPTAVLKRLGAPGPQSIGAFNLTGSNLLLKRRERHSGDVGGEDEDEEDEELELSEQAARLANAVGVELCRIHEEAASSSVSGSAGADGLRSAAYGVLESMFPFLLHYLANEYDDTSSCVFPFLGDVLGVFRRMAKSSPTVAIADGISAGFGASSPSALTAPQRDFLLHVLQAVVLKMKHSPDTDPFAASASSPHSVGKQTNGREIFPSPTHAPIPGAVGATGLAATDDSAYGLFMEMRKQLKVFYDSIAAIDHELWLSFVCNALSNVLSIVSTSVGSNVGATPGTNGGQKVEWADVELALHLVYLMGEAERGAISFVAG